MVKDLNSLYENIRDVIKDRIEQFDCLRENADNKIILKEIVFCLMTPQSKARVCSKAADRLFLNDAIFEMSEKEISEAISSVRFKNNKARYIKETVKKFKDSNIKGIIENFKDMSEARKWFVNNIKGFGYKEASHFLRNTGYGYELAILDRHILKNLLLFGIIDKIPKSMTPMQYERIEKKMKNFSKKINIPMHHLDFVFWYKETGEVFK